MTRHAPGPEPPPSEELIVSGGGSTMVATDEILAHAAVLQLLSHEAESWHEQVQRIRALEDTAAPGWRPGDAGLEIFTLARTINAIKEHSRDLSDALVRAAEGYGQAERRIELLARLSAAGLASALGYLAPFIALMAVPSLTAGAVAWLLAGLVSGTTPGDAVGGAGATLGQFVTQNPRLLTNPVVVAAVRALASAGDDAAAGVLKVPLPLSLALGDDGAKVFGVATSAAAIVAVARAAGALRETRVDTHPVGAGSRSPPPSGVAGLARRIPSASGVNPQLRIERYGTPAKPAWVVYAGGTAAWSPVAGADPWDTTSNAAAVAEQSSGSYRAVVDAMVAAGVGPDDPVIGVGHSQGGLIMAQVAASGDFNTVGLATFGAPAGQVAVPESIPVIATEHADDLVPALGGVSRDDTAPGNHHLVVRREVFAGRDVPAGEALPAHSMQTYRDTARMIDASPEPRLIEFRAQLDATLGSEPGTATFWRATREPGP